MRTILSNAFNHWQTTLLGAAVAALEYVAHPAADAGTGWQIVAIIVPFILGAIAKDPAAK